MIFEIKSLRCVEHVRWKKKQLSQKSDRTSQFWRQLCLPGFQDLIGAADFDLDGQLISGLTLMRKRSAETSDPGEMVSSGRRCPTSVVQFFITQ